MEMWSCFHSVYRGIGSVVLLMGTIPYHWLTKSQHTAHVRTRCESPEDGINIQGYVEDASISIPKNMESSGLHVTVVITVPAKVGLLRAPP